MNILYALLEMINYVGNCNKTDVKTRLYVGVFCSFFL